MCPSRHLDCSDNHTRFSWASDCETQHHNQIETLLLDSIYEVLLPEYYTLSRRGRGQQVSMRLSRHLQHMLFLRVQVPSAYFQVFWRDHLGCYPMEDDWRDFAMGSAVSGAVETPPWRAPGQRAVITSLF